METYVTIPFSTARKLHWQDDDDNLKLTQSTHEIHTGHEIYHTFLHDYFLTRVEVELGEDWHYVTTLRLKQSVTSAIHIFRIRNIDQDKIIAFMAEQSRIPQ